MYAAMNRFHIKPGQELIFETLWRERESYLETVKGFRSLFLLRGDTFENYTLYISQFIWNSKDDFDAWAQSESFIKAHMQFGDATTLFADKPAFEGFKMVLHEKAKKM